ncbi:MAG: hypothetical protein ACYCUV_16510, partial [Phycisphaerae bacterium]
GKLAGGNPPPYPTSLAWSIHPPETPLQIKRTNNSSNKPTAREAYRRNRLPIIVIIPVADKRWEIDLY